MNNINIKIHERVEKVIFNSAVPPVKVRSKLTAGLNNWSEEIIWDRLNDDINNIHYGLLVNLKSYLSYDQ